MRKILGLTVAAVLVMGLVGGGTWAYFSDTESITNNYFAAGTLDLEVDSENPWTSIPCEIADIAPGANSGDVTITCENIGNLVGDLYIKITNVSTSDGDLNYPTGTPAASSEPEYDAGGGFGSGYVAVNDIDTKLTINCDWNSSGVSGIDNTLLSAMPSTWTLLQDAFTDADGVINLVLSADLAGATDNNYQGDKCNFDIELYLVQDGQTP
jgi:predicted ribosomally synthesized peptide with SipW-like signal peptide